MASSDDSNDLDDGFDDETAAAPIVYERTVDAEAAGQRLDKWLATVIPTLSRARLQQLIGEKRVSVNGQTIGEGSRRVKPGQTVRVEEPPPIAATPQPEAIALTVVYEDDDLIVIDKAAGMVVHPGPGNPDHTLVNALLAHCGPSLSGIGGERRPGIVHRLDKDTSGLMIAAKTDLAHHGLAEQFACHSLTREYLCLVWGRPRPAAGSIDAPLGRHPTQRKKMAVVSRGGKRALTHYRVVGDVEGVASIVKCTLSTGRTHQVRVHMAHIGHPLLGDAVYGHRNIPKKLPGDLAERIARLTRQALHSFHLGFLHPRTRESLEFLSELPLDISAVASISSRNAIKL
ncbi:RNA pseudouridine synthase [Rhodospirillum rubrum]|uniref:RluA family pseudouridine synthase n=1 Tax=Rhodospirillum rubrum TaxID=1085 RepID=UPI00190586E8|nr:RluA family pseudouridine synthase [Rhodospirillum rubrum]MBK1664871.1 RNA pseudouridine synthase [Rhodospirillum rubrum]MBK1676304.1 RNA pseudouridine synthase [Rhodospirillum rubrum]